MHSTTILTTLNELRLLHLPMTETFSHFCSTCIRDVFAGISWTFAACAVVLYATKLIVAIARDDVKRVVDAACVDPADYAVYVRGLPQVEQHNAPNFHTYDLQLPCLVFQPIVSPCRQIDLS